MKTPISLVENSLQPLHHKIYIENEEEEEKEEHNQLDIEKGRNQSEEEGRYQSSIDNPTDSLQENKETFVSNEHEDDERITDKSSVVNPPLMNENTPPGPDITPLKECCENSIGVNLENEDAVDGEPFVSPRIVVTSPNGENVQTTIEQPRKHHRKLTRYDPAKCENEDGQLNVKVTRKHTRRRHSRNSFKYDNPNFVDFNIVTQEYYQFLNRYHLGDTLSIFNRSSFQIELRKHGIDHISIGLFGQPGSGKSALLNSMFYAMNGRYIEYSQEQKCKNEHQATNSLTNNRVELRLTETITIIDNRGIDVSVASCDEVEKQCEGYRQPGEFVPQDWKHSKKQQVKDLLKRCNKKKLIRNRIQCPLIVNSLKEKFNAVAMAELIKSIQISCFCNPVVILTNKDFKNAEDVIKNRTEEFQNLNCARIFIVENYTYFNHSSRNVSTDEIIIEALFNCCIVADQTTYALLKKIDKLGSCCS